MADDLDASIGQRLFRRRRLMGMTQKQVGEAIGVRFQQIQKYECGANRISAARLWRLAQALDVPVAHFFGASGAIAAADLGDDLDSLGAKGETHELIRAFAHMDERPRKRLLSLARSLTRGRAREPFPVNSSSNSARTHHPL